MPLLGCAFVAVGATLVDTVEVLLTVVEELLEEGAGVEVLVDVVLELLVLVVVTVVDVDVALVEVETVLVGTGEGLIGPDGGGPLRL